MINGVVIQKLQSLDVVLTELRSLGEISVSQLNDDWRVRRAVERDLQVLVEIAIDVCQRLLSLSGQTPATSGADAIARCVQLGVLSNAEVYRRMVQFRNFIVHRYEQVDVAILVDVVNTHLRDFDRFRTEVLAYVSRELDRG